MENAQPVTVDAVWPEHGEDLTSVIFLQSLLQRFEPELAITSAAPRPDELNPVFTVHPLNTAHRELTSDECTRLWNDLAFDKPDTIVLADLKAEVLRQVRIYIRKGLEMLRKTQTSPLSSKRSRSASVNTPEPSTKKHKVDDGESFESRPSEPSEKQPEEAEKESGSSQTDQPEQPKQKEQPEQPVQQEQQEQPENADEQERPAQEQPAQDEPAQEQPEQEQPEQEQPKQEQPEQEQPEQEEQSDQRQERPEPGQQKERPEQPAPVDRASSHAPEPEHAQASEPAKTNLPPQPNPRAARNDSDINESDSSGHSDVPDSDGPSDPSLPQSNQDATRALEDKSSTNTSAEQPAKTDAEGRSPKATTSSPQPEEKPADKAWPEKAAAAARDASNEAKKLAETPRLEVPAEPQDDSASLPRTRRRSRASRASRSARTTPQSSRAGSAEPASVEASPAPGEESNSDLLDVPKHAKESKETESPKEPSDPKDAAESRESKDPKDSTDQRQAPRTRKRRRSSTSEVAPYSDGSLKSLIATLQSATVLEPFTKPFSEGSSRVLSPTDLSLIQMQIDKDELASIDLVEQELAKMLANAVVGSQMDVNDAAAYIFNEVAEFKKNTPSRQDQEQPPAAKRRR